MDKTTFVNRAMKIQNAVEYLDNASDAMTVDFWETPIAEPINIALEIFSETLGIIEDCDLKIFFNAFWTKKEDKDWEIFYDNIIPTMKLRGNNDE